MPSGILDQDLVQSVDSSEALSVRTVGVDLGERSYDILIGSGLIDRIGPLIADLVGKDAASQTQCAVVSDETVAHHYLERSVDSLKDSCRYAGEVVVKPGEGSKSFDVFAPLCEDLLSLGLERGDLVVALGGGVIGDLAGFAASVFRRGVRFVQVPTSLLAQVDSSVGGKTGINSQQGKNLIGTFHQPSLVVADTTVLDTLDPRQFRSGYAEVVKYGLINNPQFFSWLENNGTAIFESDGDERAFAIETSCRSKAAIVEKDEKEAGVRALLNLGHTFGHALEAWTGYSDRLYHGEAVSIGMVLAFEFSDRLKLCAPEETQRVKSHLAAIGLPTQIDDIAGTDRPEVDALLTLMMQDKKVRQGRIALVLVRAIGDAFLTRDVDLSELREFLTTKC